MDKFRPTLHACSKPFPWSCGSGTYAQVVCSELRRGSQQTETTRNPDKRNFRGQHRIGTFVRSPQFLRKEVNNMKTYSKPDVALLGDAALLIQSSKLILGENGIPTHPNVPNDVAE